MSPTSYQLLYSAMFGKCYYTHSFEKVKYFIKSIYISVSLCYNNMNASARLSGAGLCGVTGGRIYSFICSAACLAARNANNVFGECYGQI